VLTFQIDFYLNRMYNKIMIKSFADKETDGKGSTAYASMRNIVSVSSGMGMMQRMLKLWTIIERGCF